MKTFASHSVMRNAVLAAVVCACAVTHASEKLAPATNEVVVPKSVFVNNPDAGKDPFFPTSTRRLQSLVRVTATNSVPQSSRILDQLALKGISGTKAEPLAIINGVTVAKGELAEIKCGRQIVKVRCLEIRDSSVLIELHGTRETRELRLREGI
jgi:hypothetical protein